MSAIPTIWFLLKLLWTHRTHLGNYASCNAGLTCQCTAQGQPGDWPSCDKSALTSSKLIWPGADCWQLIILAIHSSKEVQGRWGGEWEESGREKGAGKEKGETKKKWIFIFIPPLIFLLAFFCWTYDELRYLFYLFTSPTVQSSIWTVTHFCCFGPVLQCIGFDMNNDSEVRLSTFIFHLRVFISTSD